MARFGLNITCTVERMTKNEKMLESRSEDALVLLVKLVKSTVETVEAAQTVEIAETVLTEDLKKYDSLTH